MTRTIYHLMGRTHRNLLYDKKMWREEYDGDG